MTQGFFFLRGESVRISVHMGQGQKLTGPGDHCHAGADIKQTPPPV